MRINQKTLKQLLFAVIFVILAVTEKETLAEEFSLRLPVAGYTAYTVPVSAVFDHSMNMPYFEQDRIVVAYSGDRGDYEKKAGDYCTCFNQISGNAFNPSLNYIGTSSCGSYYYLCYDAHPGTDFVIACGKPVYAAESGIAKKTKSFPGTSNAERFNTIEIDHQNGYKTYYLHLSNHAVKGGELVKKGQLIAYSGDYGCSGACHLHFEIQLNGVPVDPYGWIGNYPDPYTKAANINLWISPYILNQVFLQDIQPGEVLSLALEITNPTRECIKDVLLKTEIKMSDDSTADWLSDDANDANIVFLSGDGNVCYQHFFQIAVDAKQGVYDVKTEIISNSTKEIIDQRENKKALKISIPLSFPEPLKNLKIYH